MSVTDEQIRAMICAYFDGMLTGRGFEDVRQFLAAEYQRAADEERARIIGSQASGIAELIREDERARMRALVNTENNMNFGAITRRIRLCESEVPAQLVLEYAINSAIEKERDACAKRVEKYMLETYGNHYGVAADDARRECAEICKYDHDNC